MMNECKRKLQTVQVDHYDGQAIYSNDELLYELGGYLGGGAAGVVYEAFCMRTQQHVAIKILNPVGYKLLPSTLLARCVVAVKGKPLDAARPPDQAPLQRSGIRSSGSNASATPMRLENVWWLLHPTTKQAIAAFEDPRTGMLRELTLPQCIDVWGAALSADSTDSNTTSPEAAATSYQEVEVKNHVLRIPRVPKKFLKFAYTRRSIHREISNMSGLDLHANVLRLDAALELVQDSKCTTFLVLELAAGGELFDRIKLDCGTDEATARRYFCQLVSGVAFCHASGVCHRDLKPENLLLADTEELSTLKIADFGLSAIFAFTDSSSSSSETALPSIRRLRSVVGSPHYVAPEVLLDAGQGYDGAKADAWSIGVILYAMLAGNLPFGKDLLTCLRYDKFRKWSYHTKYSDDDPTDEGTTFPTWFFPHRFSTEVKSLIAQLLYPDPGMRLGVGDAQHHPWALNQRLLPPSPGGSSSIGNSSSHAPVNSPLGTASPIAVAAAATVGSAAPTVVVPPAYKSRANVVVSVPPPPTNAMAFDAPLEHRWSNSMAAARSGMTSPHGFARPLGRSFCPPSPQMSARTIALVAGGYMPSVDEETSPHAGQTPPTSPTSTRACAQHAVAVAECSATDVRAVESASNAMQFDLELDDASSSSSSESSVSPAVEAVHDDADTVAVESTAAESSLLSVDTSVAPTEQQSANRAAARQFISPPLALASRSSLFHRSNQHRRNSPPDLSLSMFEKAAKLEAIRTCSLEQLDLSGAANTVATKPTTLSPTPSDDVTPDAPLRTYSDHVARSTRFVTALPAQLVLAKIESLLAARPSPMPAPYRNVPQRVTIDWTNYQLEVRYGSMLTCTVQVFLYQRGVYLVEFRRGQVEIFQFKRFYEDIRERISASTESSSSSRTSALMPTPSAHKGRRRNKSVAADDEL